jgi:Subunit CCDC53 of WASH complex
MDLSRVKSAPIHETLVLINNFVLNTTRFLNSFSDNVERKISHVSTKVTELEILLAVLEAKLNSIPGLEFQASALPEPSVPSASATVSAPLSVEAPLQPPSSIAAGATISAAPAMPDAAGPGSVPNDAIDISAAESKAADSDSSDGVRAADHPDYAPFLKMMRVGVPAVVVVGKLTAAGKLISVHCDLKQFTNFKLFNRCPLQCTKIYART